jgi:glutamine synthetase
VSATELVALVCCDLGAIVRGRSVFASELGEHLAAGVGWVPANHSITPLGTLAESTPFGSVGDLRLLPEIDTRVRVEAAPGEGGALDFVLCDIVETDGAPWRCCPRQFLREALEALASEFGISLRSSFEHEFQLVTDAPAAAPFSLEAQRRAEPFAGRLMAALAQAGAQPERFFPEYAPHQFELPVAAALALAGADRSVVLKEVVREVSRRNGLRASFAPLLDPDWPGNGVHIHLNLLDAGGRPLLYDPQRPAQLSELGGRFAAGILRHARALSALTAPSPASAARLVPHRWSVGAVCLAERNREALLRIPPVVTLGGADPASQLRLEYRGADATANPYLALGALVRAGLEGLRQELRPPPVLRDDPSHLDDADAACFGVGGLPDSLESSLQALDEDHAARAWMAPLLHEAYVGVKRSEVDAARGSDLSEVCRRYAQIY